MSLFDLQDVCIAIGSMATLDLPMVVDLIGIYGLKGPYCTLTMTDWFLQALSVIPRGSWDYVARRFTMIRWAVDRSDLIGDRSYDEVTVVGMNRMFTRWTRARWADLINDPSHVVTGRQMCRVHKVQRYHRSGDCQMRASTTELEHCDVLSMQIDSDLVIYRTTLVRTFQVSTRSVSGKCVYLVTLAMSLFDLQDVCIAIGSIATLDLPMVVDLIGIYGLKGPYCTLTTTNWFLQPLSVIPMESWGDVARRFTMIRWAIDRSDLIGDRSYDEVAAMYIVIGPEPVRPIPPPLSSLKPPPPPPPPPRAAAAAARLPWKIVCGQFDKENPFVLISSVLLVQADEGVSFLVMDRIGDYYRNLPRRADVIVTTVGARHKCQQDDEVFNFSNTEFTREDLITALNKMVHEYKKLSQTFEEVKTENMDLKNSSVEPSAVQHGETDSLQIESSKLKTENDSLRLRSYELESENENLVMSSCTQFSVSLSKLHEIQKPLNDKSGLGFNAGESSFGETCTQSNLVYDLFKKMNFVKASVIHDTCESVRYDDQISGQLNQKGKAGIGYVRPESSKSSWLKNRLDKDKAKAGSKSFVQNQQRRGSKKVKYEWRNIRPRRDLNGQNTKPKLNRSHHIPAHTLMDFHTGKTVKLLVEEPVTDERRRRLDKLKRCVLGISSGTSCEEFVTNCWQRC
ncbi:Serine/threonine protein kinase-related domain containing protein [Dorcoceras hygrometricum]|uniref:Serine/threonine protein kinase-related domain containing protein n=1 Tax=Dorcoceras hygrometricum TaxID=472368 RepID=A0A2Z7AKD0_9LAMI|nr:Serine/threonine protein kinase-related domain containing protein [Dorcoceras hygrometricum]